jgi:hypothetical protein
MVFISLRHGKEHQICGIRAIIKTIQAGNTITKFIYKNKLAMS